jgi:hypothetical protein
MDKIDSFFEILILKTTIGGLHWDQVSEKPVVYMATVLEYRLDLVEGECPTLTIFTYKGRIIDEFKCHPQAHNLFAEVRRNITENKKILDDVIKALKGL